MRARPAILAAVLAVAASGGVVMRASADTLVLRDGSRVETKGPWQVKGKQVIFTQKDGRLGALRLIDVDLDASARATASLPSPEPAKPAAPAAEPVKKKPVLVLTDKDVRHVDQNGMPVSDETAPKKSTEPPTPPVGAVIVETWERAPHADGTGIDVLGVLKNTGRNEATEITVVAKLYDEKGSLLGTADGALDSATLRADGSTHFKASFAGIVTFATARFEVKNKSTVPEPPKPGEPQSTSSTAR